MFPVKTHSFVQQWCGTVTLRLHNKRPEIKRKKICEVCDFVKRQNIKSIIQNQLPAFM